jgi:hypothetical protein
MYDIMLRTYFSASINNILYNVMLRINSEIVHFSVMQTCYLLNLNVVHTCT